MPVASTDQNGLGSTDAAICPIDGWVRYAPAPIRSTQAREAMRSALLRERVICSLGYLMSELKGAVKGLALE